MTSAVRPSPSYEPPPAPPESPQGTWLSRWAWLPVPLFLVIIAILWPADVRTSYESPPLLMGLNFVFSTLVCLFVAYLVARSFLVRATPGLLLFGCGVVVWGAAGLVGTSAGRLAMHGRDFANVTVTIHNLCVWLSALCFLTSAILSVRPREVAEAPGIALGAGYVLSVGAVGLITLSVLADWTPAFFVQGEGGTPVRQALLGSAIAMFALTALLLWEPFGCAAFVRPLVQSGIGTDRRGPVRRTDRAVPRKSAQLGRTRRTVSQRRRTCSLQSIASVRESDVRGISLEAALREVEQRYHTLVDLCPDAILVHSQGKYVYANQAAARLLGTTSPDDLIGLDVLQCVGAEHRAAARERIERAYAGQVTPLRQLTFIRLDGTTVDVEVTGTGIDFGSRPAVQVVVRDVSKRKQTDEQLRELSQRLSYHVDHSPLAVIEWGADMRLIRWSGEAERLFGWKADEVLGKRMEEFRWIYHEDEDQVADVSGELRSGADPRRFSRNRNYRKDGSVVDCEWYNSSLVDESGKLLSILSLVLDVTARTRAELQLKDVNSTLEQRVAERTAEAQQRSEQLRALAAQLTRVEQNERQRLARVLHDHLQQLLVGTKFHLGILRSQLEDARQRESVRQVDNLLDESLEASRSLTVELCPPILQQGNLAQVLQWLAQWFGGQHGLTVEVHAQEHANPQNYEIRVLLFQAVRELLFNVVKHANVNRACVEVTRTTGARVKVIVSDSGDGFDPCCTHARGHIAGGFGLFSVRERLDWLGGHIDIQSAPGRGTRVAVFAPLGSDVQPNTPHIDDAPAIAAAEPAVCPAQDGTRKIRVLLADDHEIMRTGLARLLQMQSWIEVVGQASDGRQAVDLAHRLQPDVVITDVSMPVMDGKEATRRIVASQPAVKVIGLSMFAEPDVAEAMKEAGAIDYLAKSSGPDALVAAIRQCVATSVAAPIIEN